MPTDPAGNLEWWAAEARASEAADSRIRERFLRTQQLESASLAGVMAGLGEEGTLVAVTTVAGRRHTGRVAMVGDDFLVIDHPGNARATLVRLAALGWVAPVDGDRPNTPRSGSHAGAAVASQANVDTGAGLSDVLARAAGERRRVGLWIGTAAVFGEVIAVGEDVITVDTGGGPARVAYVSLASVSEISLFDSG